MNNQWMTVKARYTKQLENGTFKRVSEPYLLAAMNFSDAETRIYEELGTIIRGEFSVTAITRTEIHDIFHYEDSDVWYTCKIKFDSSTDEGKSKKVTQTMLVSADSVKQATERLKESLSGMMVDYVITGVVVSPLIDIFPYREELDREISRKPLADGDDFVSLDGVVEDKLVIEASLDLTGDGEISAISHKLNGRDISVEEARLFCAERSPAIAPSNEAG